MDHGDDFVQTLLTRVRTARATLADAVASADTVAVPEALDELESALQALRRNGIEEPADTAGPVQRNGS